MKSALLIAGFSAISAESIDLDTAIENLRVLNDWVETSLYEQEMAGTKVGDRMEKWQGDLQEAFRAGASRSDLGKLLFSGRKLRLDLMIDHETGRCYLGRQICQ